MNIRNVPGYYFRRPGHCTMCEVDLADEAYMVREPVCWRVLGDVALWSVDWTPVCEPCAGPSRSADASKTYVCGGCGLTIKSAPAWRGKVCSERCEQRTRRARRKTLAMRRCKQCIKTFHGRANARFCSHACKQSAYRGRSVSVSNGPTVIVSKHLDATGPRL